MRPLILLMGYVWLVATEATAQHNTAELLICGDSLFRIYTYQHDTLTPQPGFTWHAGEDRQTYPAAYAKLRSFDDCKPSANGQQIALTSSYEGGVAILDRRTRRLTFFAPAPNAHSAEWLPGNRLAVALSTAPAGGNRVVVYDLANPSQPIWHDTLYSAHGLVWDTRRRVLYALGYNELRTYHPNPKTNGFTRQRTYPLPGHDGHELQAIPGTDSLLVSTHEGVWSFDRASGTFAPYRSLGHTPLVKSVAFHPTDNQLTAYVQAEEKWWGNNLHFLHKQAVPMPGIKLYKIRWWVRR
jgi:hypothetical protein